MESIMALHAFENKEYGIVAVIEHHTNGFYVRLKDDDAGEYVPMGFICPTEEMAIKKAKELVA